jgi:hypothetical protein
MGTTNGIELPLQFTSALRFDEQVVQHMCGAHFLSWSPSLQPKYKEYAFFLYLQLTQTFLKQMSLLRMHNKIYLDYSYIYEIFKSFNVTRQKWWHKEKSDLKQFTSETNHHFLA